MSIANVVGLALTVLVLALLVAALLFPEGF
ncbi:potassium-transporting ATPase subunit F [Mycolicibacter minnesotensis]|nr:potassium-transporting ATPase subunit F [Mycolicibacter minnesotensis]